MDKLRENFREILGAFWEKIRWILRTFRVSFEAFCEISFTFQENFPLPKKTSDKFREDFGGVLRKFGVDFQKISGEFWKKLQVNFEESSRKF